MTRYSNARVIVSPTELQKNKLFLNIRKKEILNFKILDHWKH